MKYLKLRLLLDEISKIEEAKYKLQKSYTTKLNTILSSKKRLKLMNAEHTFRHKNDL